MSRDEVSASGRKPPPVEYRFLKGKSGNRRGRPVGAVSQRKIVRRVALKKVAGSYGGVAVRQTILEHVLDALKRGAARGSPPLVAELSRLSNKLSPPPEEQRGGFLVVPETLTHEECIAQMEARNATARDPSLPPEELPPDPEAEARAAAAKARQALVDAEVAKARKGLPSPLGEAILAFQRKWG